jgi:hypothetical protein
MMINWKLFGRKRWWHNFKVLSRHSHGVTEEKHETSQSGQPVAGQESNTEPPEYEAGVLTTRPLRSVRPLVGLQSMQCVDSLLHLFGLSHIC